MATMNELRYFLCAILASIALVEAGDEILIGSKKSETTSIKVSSIKTTENLLNSESSPTGQPTDPCQNGGTYLDNKDYVSGLKYTCFCTKQFTGLHCELLITKKKPETTTSMDVTTTSIKTTEKLPTEHSTLESSTSTKETSIASTTETATSSVETTSAAVEASTEYDNTPEVNRTYHLTNSEALTSENESETSTPLSSTVEVQSTPKTNYFSTSTVRIADLNSTTSFEDWIVTRSILDSGLKNDKKSIVKYASIGTSLFILILALIGCFVYYRRYSRSKSLLYYNDQV